MKSNYKRKENQKKTEEEALNLSTPAPFSI